MEDEEERNRDQAWVETAISGELKKLEELSEDENINKPGSAFFACLLKIGAIVKGTGQPFITYEDALTRIKDCLLYTSPSPRDRTRSRMPSSA